MKMAKEPGNALQICRGRGMFRAHLSPSLSKTSLNLSPPFSLPQPRPRGNLALQLLQKQAPAPTPLQISCPPVNTSLIS